jgi:FdhD protein
MNNTKAMRQLSIMLPIRNASKIKLRRMSSAGASEASSSDFVAVEEPLEIQISTQLNGQPSVRSISVTMRTPGDDFELAAGFLFSEGLITREDDIHEIRYCTGKNNHEQQYNVVNVHLRPDVPFNFEHLQRNFFMSSSCGLCGKASLDQVRTTATLPLNPNAPRVKASIIMQLPDKLRASQPVFDKTGGLHAAGLFDVDGTLMLAKEDVGRHNALDKLIGDRLLNKKFPLDNQILMVSGRTSFEIIQKARMAGIGFVAAVGAPSSLAIELAKEAGMTLAGFVRSDKLNVYSAEHRILG